MIQLSYQPALDPFHTIFRYLRLRDVFRTITLPKDQLRILDFLLLFPFAIREMRLRQAHRSYKKFADEYGSTRPYGQAFDPHIAFERMRPIQDTAVHTLSNRGFIDSDLLRAGGVRATEQELPRDVAMRVSAANNSDVNLINFLNILVDEYRFDGVDGIKHRSGLMDHRYDAV